MNLIDKIKAELEDNKRLLSIYINEGKMASAEGNQRLVMASLINEMATHRIIVLCEKLLEIEK